MLSLPDVDRINATFYGRVPYPWPALYLDRPHDPHFERIMLCQSLGDWGHRLVPAQSRIWVAGCGTNQAVLTALAFPEAEVVGSDISQPSLEHARQTAADLSIHNLELRHESVNDAAYDEEFDYVLCTGVIHHTADPQASLLRLSRSMQPGGVLELMVHNRYHRTIYSALQHAIRILAGPDAEPASDVQFGVVSSLMKGYRGADRVLEVLDDFQDARREVVADTLLQPVEHSFDVGSLGQLAQGCGLRIVQPCVNQFDRTNDSIDWSVRFFDPALAQRYWELSDQQRWHVANLLLGESSPHLWFYLMRAESEYCESEVSLCQSFLATRFVPAETTADRFTLQDRRYVRSSRTTKPSSQVPRTYSCLVRGSDGVTPMSELFARYAIPRDLPTVNECRLRLTTPQFPYLRAVG